MAYPHDTTAEHPLREPTTVNGSSPNSFIPGKRVIDESSGNEMATETRWLVQQRLRAASLVLVVGFALFFARSLVLHWHRLESRTVLFHGIMLGLLLLSLAALSSRWKPTLRQLRWFEVALFSLIIASFMAAQFFLMLRGVRDNDPLRLLAAVKSSVLWMLAMIVTYAIFIPNNWKRAAKMIVPMAMAPVAVPWILGLAHPELYQVAIRAANFEKISEDGLFLLLGAFTAIFGTHTINTLRISQEGTVAGSPLYMAPEQVMHNQPPDRPTDIYGLGAVAYYTLTGRPPFMGKTSMEVMVAHARDPVIPPSQIQPNIPPDLEAIVLRCLEKNPRGRYPNTQALARELAACADAPNWSPQHAADWWRANLRWNPNESTAPLVSDVVEETVDFPVSTDECESAEIRRCI